MFSSPTPTITNPLTIPGNKMEGGGSRYQLVLWKTNEHLNSGAFSYDNGWRDVPWWRCQSVFSLFLSYADAARCGYSSRKLKYWVALGSIPFLFVFACPYFACLKALTTIKKLHDRGHTGIILHPLQLVGVRQAEHAGQLEDNIKRFDFHYERWASSCSGVGGAKRDRLA